MIRILFHRTSRMVRALEIMGVAMLLAAAVRGFVAFPGAATTGLLLIVAALYGFLRFCAVRRWYPDAPRFSGIELQFQKAMAPTSYVLAIAMAWFLAAPGVWPLIVAAVLLGVVAHVNLILIAFHRRDRDPLPVNAFSGAVREDDAVSPASSGDDAPLRP